MQKKFSIVLIWLLTALNAFATHNRAGEITYRHISGYTFEFTITTYTYRYSPANRSQLPVDWGDGTSSIVPIAPPGHFPIPNTDYYKNVYIARHTYPGAGVYAVLMQDPNRNQGVKNIPNSVNTIFSIKTTLLVGSSLGANSTPILLNPPIDKAAKGHIFIHNPGAYDPDGDSLSYAITTCTGANGDPIEGYTLPAASDTLFINPVTGDLKWITPTEVGAYNIAILVEEWRKGIKIGQIERDMQINVYDTKNNPPVNDPIKNYCVLAGDSVIFHEYASDKDGDLMTQQMVGGGFEVSNPSVYSVDSAGHGWLYSSFKWVTTCAHARKQPYTFVLRTDDLNSDISLVDITSFTIRVMHRAPENIRLKPGVDTIRVEWDPSTCGTPAGYFVYRRIDSFNYTPDSCTTGLPAYTGYKKIGTVQGANASSFRDDNNKQGLVPGYNYCYRVTAYYNDGDESIPSEEACTTLVAGTPPILQVSVTKDDSINGQIDLAWAVPHLDDTTITGPFRYDIERMKPGETVFTKIKTIDSPDLKDTTYSDTGINTLVFPYTYSVILYYEKNSNWIEVPGSETATSQYIIINGADNQLTLSMKKRSPWLNLRYDVFRKNMNTGVFDSIGTTNKSEYVDSLLINNKIYTYRTIGIGKRPLYGTEYFVKNISHLASGIPIDTVPPCPPDLTVTSECDSSIAFNYLTWDFTPDSCKNQDVVKFRIYNRDSLYGPFNKLDSVAPDVYSYKDYAKTSIEQCYAVTAVDSAGNESAKIPFCVYNLCGLYELPNVFTPNNAGPEAPNPVNDIYVSKNLNNYIKKVNMTIYNRYGKVIYKTTDPAINWDGKSQNTNKLVSTGVYYYVCDVYEPTINGTILRTLTGFIHVYSSP